jgi:aspartyl-tRNA(Asn)/glutamyl-tRNA(Gln) amidotransferase subunit B
MFCGCEVVDSTSAQPNTYICEICTGMPGTLPVINERAVEFAVRVALALDCEIAETSVFARKNYFYPDLPKGFQISQYEMPLARHGRLEIETREAEKQIRIRRVHLEEDTGKLSHRSGYSLVDFNRSGIPLLEIVSEPDLHSLEEVRSYAIALRSLLRHLRVNSGDMEKGVIRFEANVSVRLIGSDALKTRTEIKNLNSFRAMERAVAYEIERQSQILSMGKEVSQETLGWDDTLGVTVTQRSKEEAHDYRYFPEPDLPPLHINPAWIEEIKANLPELPQAKRKRFLKDFDLSPYMASVLTSDAEIAGFFEQAVSAAPDVSPKQIANWLSGDFFRLLNEAGISIEECKISAQQLAELVTLVDKDEISASVGKNILAEMFESGKSANSFVEERDLRQISDHEAIQKLIYQVLEAFPEQRQQYLEGKRTISQWFFGQVMRATKGRANPSVVRMLLDEALQELEKSDREGL